MIGRGQHQGNPEITHLMSPAIFISSQLLQPCQEHPTTSVTKLDIFVANMQP